MTKTVTLEIVEGDILNFSADLLAFKYAEMLRGADWQMAITLAEHKLLDLSSYEVNPGDYDVISTESSGLAARWVMFVGMGALNKIGYDEIEQLAIDVLRVSAEALPSITTIAMTCHGPGFGLDENTAFKAQLRGYIKALQAGIFPSGLERITIVEHNAKRVARLVDTVRPQELSARLVPGTERGVFTLTLTSPPKVARDRRGDEKTIATMQAKQGTIDTPTVAGLVADEATYAKPHAFVAMPFHAGMDDVFFYGIQQPVHRIGMLCERADFDQFTGDVMGYVRERIEKAAVVIADLTGANANVYLEVGFAWGRQRPTVLLVNDEKELLFDVKGQRCLVYKSSIRSLEQMLEKELNGLVSKGIVQVNAKP